MKVCSKCHIEKEESEFYKRSDKKGFVAMCKSCHYKNSKRWVSLNIKKSRQIKQKWRSLNRAKDRESKTKWRSLNREKNKQLQQEYIRKNVDQLKPKYLEHQLIKNGFTKEQIETMPALIDIKKVKILTSRINKLLKQK